MQRLPGVAGKPAPVDNASTITKAGLLEVFLDFPYTSLAVCSSSVCTEATTAYAKFWFLDNAGVQWRMDWATVRVLRMSSNTWYIMADECDGTEVAGLSKLSGTRTQPKTVFNGYYLTPFFITAVTN